MDFVVDHTKCTTRTLHVNLVCLKTDANWDRIVCLAFQQLVNLERALRSRQTQAAARTRWRYGRTGCGWGKQKMRRWDRNKRTGDGVRALVWWCVFVRCLNGCDGCLKCWLCKWRICGRQERRELANAGHCATKRHRDTDDGDSSLLVPRVVARFVWMWVLRPRIGTGYLGDAMKAGPIGDEPRAQQSVSTYQAEWLFSGVLSTRFA